MEMSMGLLGGPKKGNGGDRGDKQIDLSSLRLRPLGRRGRSIEDSEL